MALIILPVIDTESIGWAFNSPTNAEARVLVRASVTTTSTLGPGVQLVGDVDAPGATMGYGTDAGGVKGWFARSGITGAVTGIQVQGNPLLTGDVTLIQGANVTLTQSGQDITIAASNVVTITDAIEYVIQDGGTSTVIATGVKGDLEVPFGATIQQATLLADQTGSIVVDIWKDTYANYPPTVADSITASAKPTISGADKSQDSTLTGWTTSINAGDTLRFNVDSCSTITRATLSLKVQR